MPERRIHARKLIDARVRIYHSEFGTQEARIRDISEEACCLTLTDMEKVICEGDSECEEFITLKPFNMDVVFKMRFVRRLKNEVVLRFEDCVEGKINADVL
ncbi:MAG: hypothetical protein OEY89_18455 [Gammaproteobacteria bacterium]|nr:hypothetical protein [Gammaproteobacteria bacterium]